MNGQDTRPLVAHVIYRLDVGGMENGLVNLINRFPDSKYRHAIVALTEITDFRKRILKPDVTYHALHKAPGHGFHVFGKIYRLFRELRPAIVHTRNIGGLEACLPAWAAGVPICIQGEHGRDAADPDGSNWKYRLIRRLYSPLVDNYIVLSRDLEHYLVDRVGIAPNRICQLYNGVDTEVFRAAPGGRVPMAGCPFTDPGLWLVGTVGRMQAIKDQLNLARAFIRALERKPGCRERLRLVMVGDGPLFEDVVALLRDAGVLDLAWLPGRRDDVADILRGLDSFVLPSLGEGISNTILEAMASGLPVVATDVGGNRELVVAGETGELVPAADPEAMASAILRQYANPVLAQAMGQAGRRRAERQFSMESMVNGYLQVYDQALTGGSKSWRSGS